MIHYLTHDLIFHLIVFQMVVLAVLVSNLVILHCARRHAPPGNWPLVSILIPARDEETNIARCVQSLLAQDYPSFEILVLDDQSSDRTPEILMGLARSHPVLTILSGGPPPEGQAGKNWACAQLARHARGDLFFFSDADTVFHSQAVRAAVTALLGEQADLLSGFPRQQVLTWGERLLVPFFHWASLVFTPLILAYRFRLQALTIANGQMMLFRKEAYRAIGGHEGLGMAIVDDLTLARKITAAGLRWRVAHASDLITCRMYHSGREAADGFTKNLFSAFDFRLLIFLFVFLWLAVLFWGPLVVLGALAFGAAPAARWDHLGICIGLSLLLWVIAYIDMRIPAALGILYPLTVLANEVVALRSLVFSLTGQLSWKDRSLASQKWKWL